MSKQYTKDLLVGLMIWLLILLVSYPEEDIFHNIVIAVVCFLYVIYIIRLKKDHIKKDMTLWIMTMGEDGIKHWTPIDKDGNIIKADEGTRNNAD